MTNEEYLERVRAGGSICPFCGSPEITGGSVDIDGDTAMQQVTCYDCDKSWTDVYHLHHFYPHRVDGA